MSGNARNFNNMETQDVIKFFFLQGKVPKEIHTIDMAQSKRGDFSTCDAPHPRRTKTVTTPEITDQIHKLILEDRWILAKSIAKQLGISRERVGSIIHEDSNMQKLSAKWVPKCLNVNQKR